MAGERPSAAVLLVEDDADHEELVRRAVHDSGAAVELKVARHGEEALDYLFRRGQWSEPSCSPRPRLVLLDLRLPRVDGFQVLGAIKSTPALREIPVVVLTTSESEQDMARAHARDVNRYLVKPVDHRGFGELMASVESYWLELDKQPGAAEDAGS